ncbi:hypothetical protein BKD30_07850 [Tersicoccus phoenicis]|uniref:DUF4233 domain-containing protein n=1 Tax=Tersicoccus phoenicis TaxID=554083 RepID=A0A1R1LAX7_9MICC|nr:DUF4233 domain-containing protein [Tersicoccus phoenicis]OMH24679.1 hypothetical protein BKD30_07850 [Tersicoccus phoenicis]
MSTASQPGEPRPGSAGRSTKERSTKVMFASVVLVTEAFIVFFATLVGYGLLRNLPTAAVLGVGVVLAVLLLATCAVLTRRGGFAVGWVLQVLVLATGFFVPMMFVVGVLCVAAWWYGLRAGGRVDRENRQRAREQQEWERQHPLPE